MAAAGSSIVGVWRFLSDGDGDVDVDTGCWVLIVRAGAGIDTALGVLVSPHDIIKRLSIEYNFLLPCCCFTVLDIVIVSGGMVIPIKGKYRSLSQEDVKTPL